MITIPDIAWPLEVKPKKNPRQPTERMDIPLFFHQLAILITAGVPILQCFDILIQSHLNSSFQHMIRSIRADIESGNELTKALRQFPRFFDELTCQCIQTGELTGTIALSLHQIATFQEKNRQFKNKIKQAMFYPIFISMVAIGMSLIMLLFIVPRFAEFFQSMNHPLPVFTLAILHLSHCVRMLSMWAWIPILIFVIILKIYFQQFMQYLNQILIQLPIIGPPLQKQFLVHFCRSLSTMHTAGIPIADALKIIANTMKHPQHADVFLKLHLEITQGRPLHQAMQKNSLFPSLFIQLVKVGEETGRLETLLQKIIELYEHDIDHFVSKLSHLLEPLIMVILGALIGGLVIALYLPIFNLGTML